MPSVPKYGGQRVVESPFPAVASSARPPEEAFGGGPSSDAAFRQVGALAGQSMEQAKVIHKDAYDEANRQVLFRMKREFADLEAAIQEEAKNHQGKDALGYADKMLQKLDTDGAGIVSSASNREQQEMAQALFEERRGQAQRWAVGYEAAQRQEYLDEERRASMMSEINRGLRNMDDPEIREGAAKGLRALVDDEAKYNRLGEKKKEQFRLKMTDIYHAGIIQRYIARDQPAQARAYYDKNKSEIEPSNYAEIEKRLALSGDKEVADRIGIDAARGIYRGDDEEPTTIKEEPKTVGEVVINARSLSEGMPPEIRSMADERAIREYSIRQSAKREIQESAQREIYDAIEAGSTLSDVKTQMGDKWKLLTPEQREHFERLESPKGPMKLNPNQWYALQMKTANDIRKMSDMEVIGKSFGLPEDEKKTWLNHAAKVRLADPDAAEELAKMPQLMDVQARIALGMAEGDKYDADQFASFNRALKEVRTEMTQYQKLKGFPMGPDMVQTTVDRAAGRIAIVNGEKRLALATKMRDWQYMKTPMAEIDKKDPSMRETLKNTLNAYLRREDVRSPFILNDADPRVTDILERLYYAKSVMHDEATVALILEKAAKLNPFDPFKTLDFHAGFGPYPALGGVYPAFLGVPKKGE